VLLPGARKNLFDEAACFGVGPKIDVYFTGGLSGPRRNWILGQTHRPFLSRWVKKLR
jgi:hypothetical protein